MDAFANKMKHDSKLLLSLKSWNPHYRSHMKTSYYLHEIAINSPRYLHEQTDIAIGDAAYNTQLTNSRAGVVRAMNGSYHKSQSAVDGRFSLWNRYKAPDGISASRLNWR